MVKFLTKVGNSEALVIDKAILSLLKITQDTPLEITTDLGDIDHVRSLTLTVRQLLAPQEDSHFERVSKILYKRLTDDELRTYSVNNSAEWKQMQEGDILLKQNDQPMRGRQLLDIWINGVAFHGGKKELDLYLSLQEPLRSMFQQQVNSLLMDCLNISRQQRNVIREAYERSAFKFD